MHISLSVITNILDDIFLWFVLQNTDVYIALILWYSFAVIWSYLWCKVLSKQKISPKRLLSNKKILLFYWTSTLGTIFWFFSILYIGIWGNAIASKASYILMFLYSIFVAKETPSTTKKLSILIISLGIIIFALDSLQQWLSIGFIFGILGSICLGVQTIIWKYLQSTNHNTQSIVLGRSLITLIISSVLFLPYISRIEMIHPTVWLAIIFGSLSGVVLNKYFMIQSVQKYKLSTFAIANAIVPIVIFVSGVLLLWEYTSTYKTIGAIIVLVGISIHSGLFKRYTTSK